MIPKAKIEEWKALAEKATPGEWRNYGDAGLSAFTPGEDVGLGPTNNVIELLENNDDWDHSRPGCFERDEDGDFAAAAREAVPALLSEREEMLALLLEAATLSAGVEDHEASGKIDCGLECHLGERAKTLSERLAAFLKESP